MRHAENPYLRAILIRPEFRLQDLVHQVLGFLLGVIFADASEY
jgi:hypothetical protein